METFENDRQLLAYWDDLQSAYAPTRGTLQRESAFMLCYVEGLQWVNYQPAYQRLVPQRQPVIDPSSREFRAVVNRTRKHIHRTAAQTFAREFDCEVRPSPRAAGIGSAERCQLFEDFLALLLEQSGLMDAWDRANFNRCVCGDFGVGLHMRPALSRVNGSEEIVPDSLVRAFHFFPHELTLDPHNDDPKLQNHDIVGFSRAWSIQKIERELGGMMKKAGIVVEKESLQTLGQISPFEQNMHTLSGGRLFSQHKQDSTTKGMAVHHVYRKSGAEGDRFDTLEIILQTPDGARLLNPDARKSPWGGDGMPLGLLHAHPRGDSVWHESDVRGMKDDQDALNRTRTAFDRQLVHSSHLKWLVDRKAYSERNDEKIAERFNNAIAGIHLYDSGSNENRANPPALQTIPPPSQIYMQREAELDASMRESVHRAPVNDGELKSHTSEASVALARDQAGLVSDKRVYNDLMLAETLCRTLLATGLRLVSDQSPQTLKLLTDAEFSAHDLGTLSDRGEHYLSTCRMKIRPSSIRSRSSDARVRAINDAAAAQVLAPREARRALADAGVDMPLTDDDAAFSRFFNELALGVTMGEPFVPFNSGERTADLIDTLLRAMVRQTPEVRAALNSAIEQQQLYMAEVSARLQMLANPQQTGPDQGAAGAAGGAGNEGAGINDILAALDQQGAGDVAA